MKKESFFEILGDIDEKYILEAHEEDLAEKPSRAAITPISNERKTRIRHTILSIAGVAAALCLIVGGLWFAGIFDSESDPHRRHNSLATTIALTGIEEHATTVSDEGSTIAMTTVPDTTWEETMNGEETTTPPETTAGEAPGLTIIKNGEKVKSVGDPITDEDAAAYLSEHFNMIKSNLASSQVPTDDLHISEKGYCHVSYDETNSDPLTLNLSHRTYTVYNKNVLVAFITLSRLPGTNEIVHSWGYGGTWYGDYDVFLQTHKGEELLFLYVNGYFEIVIAPDGTLRNPQGEDPDKWNYIFQNIENPYEYLYSKEATYTP